MKPFLGYMLEIKIQDLFFFYYMDYVSNLVLSSSIRITVYDS